MQFVFYLCFLCVRRGSLLVFMMPKFCRNLVENEVLPNVSRSLLEEDPGNFWSILKAFWRSGNDRRSMLWLQFFRHFKKWISVDHGVALYDPTKDWYRIQAILCLRCRWVYWRQQITFRFTQGKALRVIPRGKQRLTVYRAHQVCEFVWLRSNFPT